MGFMSLAWLTGPIFDKELRVSARRRRNYVLRFVYLALLTMLVTLVWMSEVQDRGYYSAAYQISRMSEAGKTIIVSIIWFQFCMTMLIAVIMLSTSISDEIYHRTLGVLMTTPINSFQIVMGKLFSKLWQLIILMAISLPLLATIRVFGGVPWEFVIAGLCITLTGIIFTGAVSMYFSIRSRRAYGVILKTLFTGGILY
ncbi:MAG: ABC transporter permease, partial [Phycisphaerae bacterium]|nr:ABC transporter permease [Phycisphaerae bacterium]